MRQPKILVSGYFGYETNQLDGQTIKTRNIYKLFDSKKEEYNFELRPFDTQTFQKSKLNVWRMFVNIVKCDILIYIAAHNNLKYFFPIIFLLSKIFGFKINYIVVGGWLADFIKDKPIHIKQLRTIDGIYPETNELANRLRNEYNYNNVHQLQNFRITKNIDLKNSIGNHTDANNIKLVFMARVHPMKGVGTIFKLADRLIKDQNNKVKIDLYGPIFAEYENEFYMNLDKNKNVSYRGILKPQDINNTLVNYDIMLFPTRYYTEGLPGSILDAYISGIPVIATKWQYATEFVEDDVSGVIVGFDNVDEFIDETIRLINNPVKIDNLKKGTQKQLVRYSPETAWTILKNNIFK